MALTGLRPLPGLLLTLTVLAELAALVLSWRLEPAYCARRIPGAPFDGDLANWHTGAPAAIPAVVGAMDLATGAKDVFVLMTLFRKDGSPTLVRNARVR